jgi:hypothetical protein
VKDIASYGTAVRKIVPEGEPYVSMVGKVVGAAYLNGASSVRVLWPIPRSAARWHPIDELEVVPDSYVPDRSDEDTESRAAADPDDDGPERYDADATHDFYDPMGEDR